jgi:ATP-dependent Clp protease ATP-binding subunit ClpA
LNRLTSDWQQKPCHRISRPLRRLIQNVIEDPLAEGLLDQRYHPGRTIIVEVADGQFTLREVEAEALAGVS